MPHAPAAGHEGESPAPIDRFSECHVGIVRNLDALAQVPGLAQAAARARSQARQALDYFDQVIVDHHAEEEQALFPAVLQSAQPGEERDRLQAVIDRLVREHREVETLWKQIKPALRDIARGEDAANCHTAISALLQAYRAHAHYEEQVFLPASEDILGRNANHMKALGLALHLRHQSVGPSYL